MCSWPTAKGGDLYEFVRGVTFPKDVASTTSSCTRIGILRAGNLEWGRILLDDLVYVPSEYVKSEQMLRPGDLVLAMSSGSATVVGKAAPVTNPLPSMAFGAFCGVIRPKREEHVPWLTWYFQSPLYRSWLREVSSGTNINNLKGSSFLELEIPLPPVEEQRRIIGRLVEMMERTRRARAALSGIPQEGQSLITNILYSAVSGDLTRDWRLQHPGHSVAPRRLTQASTSHESEYFRPAWELPSSWVFISAREAGEVQLGRQRAPKYHLGENMRPYLRTANVFEDRIDTSDVLSMQFGDKDFETYRLKHGDILLNEGQSRELVGRPAMYRGELPDVCFQNTLVRFRSSEDVIPEYALLVFRYYLRSGRFQRLAQWSTNIAHLGAGRFAQIEFPLPPMAEQKEIVSRAHGQLDKTHTLLRSVSELGRELTLLESSVLKTVFQGPLP